MLALRILATLVPLLLLARPAMGTGQGLHESSFLASKRHIMLSGDDAGVAGLESDCEPRAEAISFAGVGGVILRGELLHPCASENSDQLPAIIFINPFGQNFKTYKPQALQYARDGYRTLSFDPRGWHSSDGKTLLDYKAMTADLVLAIDWLTSEYATGPIGATGISEGGGLSLLLAAADPRIKAIGVLSGWTDMAHSSLGATPRLTWSVILSAFVLLLGDPAALLADVIDKMRQDPPFDPEQMKREISAWYHLPKINAHKTPIYMHHALDDTLFPVNQLVDFFQALDGPKHLRIGRGFHAASEILSMRDPNGGPWGPMREWFAAYLKHERSSAMDGIIDISYKNREGSLPLRGNIWRHPSVRTQYLSYRDGNYQLTQDAKDSADPTKLRVIQLARDFSGISTGTPLVSALQNLRKFSQVKVPVRNVRRPLALAFVGEAVDQEQTIYGTPTLELVLTTKAKRGMIVAHLVDIADEPKGDLITHGVYTWSERDRQANGEVKFTIELYSTAWRLEEGHRLAVVLNGSNVEYLPPAIRPYSYQLAPEAGKQRLAIPLLTAQDLL